MPKQFERPTIYETNIDSNSKSGKSFNVIRNSSQYRLKDIMTPLEHKTLEDHYKMNELNAKIEIGWDRQGNPPSQDKAIQLGLDRKRFGGIGGASWDSLPDDIEKKDEWKEKKEEDIRRKQDENLELIQKVCANSLSKWYRNTAVPNRFQRLNKRLTELNLEHLNLKYTNSKYHYGNPKYPNGSLAINPRAKEIIAAKQAEVDKLAESLKKEAHEPNELGKSLLQQSRDTPGPSS